MLAVGEGHSNVGQTRGGRLGVGDVEQVGLVGQPDRAGARGGLVAASPAVDQERRRTGGRDGRRHDGLAVTGDGRDGGGGDGPNAVVQDGVVGRLRDEVDRHVVGVAPHQEVGYGLEVGAASHHALAGHRHELEGGEGPAGLAVEDVNGERLACDDRPDARDGLIELIFGEEARNGFELDGEQVVRDARGDRGEGQASRRVCQGADEFQRAGSDGERDDSTGIELLQGGDETIAIRSVGGAEDVGVGDVLAAVGEVAQGSAQEPLS